MEKEEPWDGARRKREEEKGRGNISTSSRL